MTYCYYSAQTTWSTTDDATQGSTLTSVTGATGPGRTVLRSSTTRRSTMSLWTIWGPSVRVAVILSQCCSQGGDRNSFKIVCKHYYFPILLSATQWVNKSKSQVFTCLPSRNSNPSRYKHYQWFSLPKEVVFFSISNVSEVLYLSISIQVVSLATLHPEIKLISKIQWICNQKENRTKKGLKILSA